MHQNSKYTILESGEYFFHHYWYKNQKMRVNLVVLFHMYGLYGCNFNFIMQLFIYKIYQRRRGGVSRLICVWFFQRFRWVSRDIISRIIQKMINLTRLYQGFWEPLGKFMVASINTGWCTTVRVITLNFFQSQQNL